ncbi:uncharacterized protein MELLADRAFT_111086 [Melampsora larici-populina 98AG31]|uniref:Uncharacterized protein n=1 Tax=Melampsora larici-populina (strain 98AG31 / pathotype 3-4-7) TaxID=747676 RepID=F4S200_MELLP|nr:uncharacterized protein MELLADRAFT_111086 [Melampsora larici-populina 98AG31]EGG01279.1 hypothetical protein MELLADRAFT_111086 [Melampsora larici-populina 98AG31]
MDPDKYFEKVLAGQSFQYRCLLCKGKSMKDTTHHKTLANHRARVLAKQRQEQHDANLAAYNPLGSFLELGEGHDNKSPITSDFGDVQGNIIIEEHDEEFALPNGVSFSEALMRLMTSSTSDSDDQSEQSVQSESPIDLVDLDLDLLLRN